MVATVSLAGLRIYLGEGAAQPAEVLPPPSPRKYWTRRGIDHGFSFPLRYFETHGLKPDWPTFLDDFCRHWPTGNDNVYVDFVRDGFCGNGAARLGSCVHFWPFDGWACPPGRSVIVEVYPSLWSRDFTRQDLTASQRDAFAIAASLGRADREGRPAAWFEPDLTPSERATAQVEGWMLGVPG